MKPLRIKMSAFGSYRDVAQIDFRKVDHGIFLITGDTGAGKTTIFDAIAYALYDHSSTDVKNGSMMRSQYADASTPTYVELEFEDRGSVYRIVRNPAYLREQKRRGKDGRVSTTMETPGVSLYLPDGTLYPGKVKETNDKIVEIVGLSAGQFTQTVMLAQGDFMRLLLASSKERKEIFSKLFDTSLYGLLQEKLHNRAKVLEAELLQGQRLWEQHSAELPPVLREAALQAKSLQTKTQVTEQLAQQIAEDEQAEALIHQKKDQLEKEQQSLTETLLQIGQERILLERLEQARKNVQQIEAGEKAAAQYAMQLEAAKRGEKVRLREVSYTEAGKRLADNELSQRKCGDAISALTKACEGYKQEAEQALVQWQTSQPALQEELIRIRQSMPDYAALRESAEKLKQTTEKQNSMEQALLQTAKTGQQLLEAKNRLLSEQEALAEAGIRQSRLEGQLVQQEERVGRLHQLICEFETVKHLFQIRQESHTAVKKSDQQLEELTAHFEELYQSFLTEQAGLLAKELKEGMPCPVCGSVSHPRPRPLAVHAPSQEQVEQARRKREQAGKQHETIQQKYLQAQAQYDAKCETVKAEGCQLVAEDFTLGQKHVDQARALYAGEKEKAAALRVQLQKAKEDYGRWQKGEEKRRQLEAQLEENRESQENGRRQYQELESQRAALQQKLSQLSERLLFPDEKQAVQRSCRLEQELGTLKQRREQTEQQLHTGREELQRQQGQLHSLGESHKQLKREKEEAERLFLRELAAQGFAGQAEYREALIEGSRLQQLEQWCRSYEEKKLRARAALTSLEEQTKHLQSRDAAPFEAALQEKKEALTELAAQEKALYLRLDQEKRAGAALKQLVKERGKLEEEFGIASRLDKTANGHVAKTASIDFQTYIQRQYFQKIIRQANTRLTEMTGGEYLLRCRELRDLSKQGEAGLDLDVYSTITGKQRDVKTLSGGESFMAALSMALGMADMIRSMAGRVRMDMMFIDEGFGTLDEQARSQAIRILCGLAGDRRLIGIISHVTQLKEQIDRKLIVTKGKQGSSIRWELD